MRDLTNLRIEHAASTLRKRGARDVDVYERKLRQNAPNPIQVINHLSEARVALMFLENGAQVTMRDSPDLEVEWLDAMFYAEVKHINRKEQDKLDEAAMRSAHDELVRIGDTYRIENRHPYEQIYDVARKKKHQYIDGAFNILVIDSSSESMEPAEPTALAADGDVGQGASQTSARLRAAEAARHHADHVLGFCWPELTECGVCNDEIRAPTDEFETDPSPREYRSRISLFLFHKG